MIRPQLLLGALALSLVLGACASDRASQPAYVVVEDNTSIDSGFMIRRIAVIDDDLLLVEAGANDLYQVRLFPGCVSVTDFNTRAVLEETGSGIDRSSRFIVDGQTCPVRSIQKVRRVRPGEVVSAPGEAVPSPVT